MYSTFFGLQIANNALRSQQIALNVTGHNIANTNTAGYSRQNANIETGTPLRFQAMGRTVSVGTGSNVNTIFRVRDAFTDNQWRNETSKYFYWSSRLTAMSVLEGVVNEPNQYSINGDLDKFWNAWSQLAENPQNSGARAVVRERAMALIDTFRHVNTQLNDMSGDMNKTVESSVRSINDIAEQIRELNIQIHRLEVSGDNPNDLKDMRDALVDELSLMVPVKVSESQDPRFTDRQVGIYQVYINDESQLLVSASDINRLVLVYDVGTGYAYAEWEVSGDPLELRDGFGQLRSTLDMRDAFLPEFRRQMDELAEAVALTVNSLHVQGQGLISQHPGPGIPFFTDGGTGSITMASLTLNPALSGMGGLANIATGLIDPDVAVSDNAIALRISNLATGWSSLSPMPVMGADVSRASSLMDYYRSQISALGVDVQQAQRMTKGQEVLLTNASNQREMVSGVSLDEEMTNLMRFQKSYSAAARLVTMIDSMLENILSMGVTR